MARNRHKVYGRKLFDAFVAALEVAEVENWYLHPDDMLEACPNHPSVKLRKVSYLHAVDCPGPGDGPFPEHCEPHSTKEYVKRCTPKVHVIGLKAGGRNIIRWTEFDEAGKPVAGKQLPELVL